MSYQHITVDEKTAIINRRISGESVTAIAADTGIPRSTLYFWINKAKKSQQVSIREKEAQLSNDPREFFKMKEHIAKLEGSLDLLKALFCISDFPLEKKLCILETNYYAGKYSVHLMCDALEVPRGTFYNYINRGKKGNTQALKRRNEMKKKIEQVYHDSNQIYGAQKIHAILKDNGEVVSISFIRELMREMGLQSIRIGSKKQHYDETRKCQNLVKRQFRPEVPNQIWVSDVTYFRSKEKTYYICAIMDLYARKIIAYRIGYSNNTHLILGTFRKAYENRCPPKGLVFHTDQGSNYRSRSFGDYLKTRGIIQSFSMAGVPYDNSVMETFFSSMKQEELYRRKYRSEQEFRTAVENYIIFYNTERPHATLKYMTPQRKEDVFYSNHPSDFAELDNDDASPH